MASQNASNIVFRKDYTAPDHQIESIDLSFDLIPTCTEVTSKIIAVPQEDRKSDDLILDGDDLTLVSIKIAGEDSVPESSLFTTLRNARKLKSSRESIRATTLSSPDFT